MLLKTGKGPPKGAFTITHSLNPIAHPKHHQWITLRVSEAKVSIISRQTLFFHRFFIVGDSI